MYYLTIKQQETIVAIVPVASLQLAKQYVASDKVATGQVAVYSTFNKAGVENTINIIKN